MKLEVTKAWCLAAARHEGDVEVGAGAVAFDHEPTVNKTEAHGHETTTDPAHLAFGRTIQLLRRKNRMTMEALAQDARVELSEVVAIETDASYRPEPRSVSQLAHVFKVNPKAFQQLAGNAAIRDTRVREEAMRFAASAGSIDRLTPEESRALEHFISALSALTDKTGG